MIEITEPSEISQLTKEKQALEVGLAFDMLEIFNDPQAGLIGPLRKLVEMAVEDMEQKRKGHEVGFDKCWGIGEEQKKGQWRTYEGCSANQIGRWDAPYIKGRVQYFKAEHCADWIRIYGEVIEKVIGAGTKEETKRTSYQKGGGEYWEKDPAKGGLRLRTDQISHEYAARQTPSWELLRGMPAAGIKRWEIIENDTIGKMDQVFGLTSGATISGTTTDNIFFFDKFGKLRLDPIFYLLPTGTIVAGGHHTLLEVALPLSLNNLIDYEVGLYSTLFPNRGALSEFASGIREIERLLGNYENHEWNHLMLTYYQGRGQPKGCFLYDRVSDKKNWQAIAKANKRLLDRFRATPVWPGRIDVLKLAHQG